MAPVRHANAARKHLGERSLQFWSVMGVGVPLVFSVVLATAIAQEQPVTGTVYTRQAEFRIPFTLDGRAGRLQEVQLLLSEDQGQSWRLYTRTSPDRGGFDFRATRDGLHSFAVRTIDALGRASPPGLQGIRPELKIVIDTRPPSVALRPRNAREGMVAVEWDVREENLDPANFNLEYRLQGARDWIPLIVEPGPNGSHTWNPGTAGPVEVRLHVRDLARNEGEDRITVTPGAQDFRASSTGGDPEWRQDAGATAPGTRYVNSKRISFNFEIKDTGPSGVSAIELWQTTDRRNWTLYGKEPRPQPPLICEVAREGIYGFTMVVRSGVGLATPPPQAGDSPQVWVEVDLTPPIVHWVRTEVGRGPESGKLFITWKATDKNLGATPITLFYSETPEGPWKEIDKNVENGGRYVWQMPAAGIPYKFLVKVDATDKAGNSGASVTASYAIVDLALPKSTILGVEPASKAGANPLNP